MPVYLHETEHSVVGQLVLPSVVAASAVEAATERLSVVGTETADASLHEESTAAFGWACAGAVVEVVAVASASEPEVFCSLSDLLVLTAAFEWVVAAAAAAAASSEMIVLSEILIVHRYYWDWSLYAITFVGLGAMMDFDPVPCPTHHLNLGD